ncbi:MAG: hypothetical protein IJ689_00970 [Alphaproteobacteria bacterium]|nr:hypothetical protein [Alphaproteobacteria bacterium]
MNKYILLLGVAAVALGSYCAYAGNSATMSVTATIAHDVSLTKVNDIDIYAVVDPAVTSIGEGWCTAGDSNPENYLGMCTAVRGAFTATVPDDEYAAENSFTISPSELTHDTLRINGFSVVTTGTDNEFDVDYQINYSGGAPSAGTHDFGSIMITYHP